ncbi:MAG: MipA/OmpV family protein [Kangiellaceae bacterium]|nr:MipA/OmpV family protein [Kangiellaceae bacterium]
MNQAPFTLITSLLVVGGLCVSPVAFSSSVSTTEPISSAISSNTQSVDSVENSQQELESSNFFEFKGILGVGYQSALYRGQDFKFIPILALTFDAEYESWFVESNSKNRISGVMGRFYMGYHLWEHQAEQFDLVWGHYTSAIDKKDKDDDVIPELINLDTRKDDELLGVRYSNWQGETYYSTELSYDILNNSHQGFVFEGYYGKVASVRNWDLTYGLGFTWYSAKVANYNLGVEAHELTEQLTVYNSGAAYAASLEFSAQIPVSQSWVLEVGVVHSFLSSNIKDSPLVVNEELSSALLGFSYVF